MSKPSSLRSELEQSSASPSGRAGRSHAVLVHFGLMALAVGVVATTFGRDDHQLASASAVAGLSVGQPPAVMGSHSADTATRGTWTAPQPASSASLDSQTLPPEPTHDAHRPAKSIPTSTASASLNTHTTVTVQAAPPVETPDVMLAIPREGQDWPVKIAPAPRDSAFEAHGGVYGLPGGKRVVYVVDASGSMVDTMPFVLLELQKALRGLRAEQSYAVLLIAGDGVVEVPTVGMKRATASSVTSSVQWLDPVAGNVLPSGAAVADAALRRALAYEPDTVVLLSDSITGPSDPLADRVRLIQLIDTANTAGSVFHTVQLRQPDPLASAQRRGTMELIALRSGGRHTYVPESQLIDAPAPSSR